MTTPAASAAPAATTTIPTVFVTAGDPVELDLLLPQPDGRQSHGVTTLSVEVAPKRLEALHEIIPTTTTFGMADQFEQSRSS